MANKGGRPPTYRTAAVLQQKIDEYFAERAGRLTITGLALHLGFCSRSTFYAYELKKPFSYTIKRARLRIEEYYEEHLIGNNAAGPIFALKNFGWTDRQDIELSGKDGTPIPITIIDFQGASAQLKHDHNAE